jgi:hypothetical protein
VHTRRKAWGQLRPLGSGTTFTRLTALSASTLSALSASTFGPNSGEWRGQVRGVASWLQICALFDQRSHDLRQIAHVVHPKVVLPRQTDLEFLQHSAHTRGGGFFVELEVVSESLL